MPTIHCPPAEGYPAALESVHALGAWSTWVNFGGDSVLEHWSGRGSGVFSETNERRLEEVLIWLIVLKGDLEPAKWGWFRAPVATNDRKISPGDLPRKVQNHNIFHAWQAVGDTESYYICVPERFQLSPCCCGYRHICAVLRGCCLPDRPCGWGFWPQRLPSSRNYYWHSHLVFALCRGMVHWCLTLHQAHYSTHAHTQTHHWIFHYNIAFFLTTSSEWTIVLNLHTMAETKRSWQNLVEWFWWIFLWSFAFIDSARWILSFILGTCDCLSARKQAQHCKSSKTLNECQPPLSTAYWPWIIWIASRNCLRG